MTEGNSRSTRCPSSGVGVASVRPTGGEQLSAQDDHAILSDDPERLSVSPAALENGLVNGMPSRGRAQGSQPSALIQIGLATYQSGPFLSDLLASLVAQTEQRFSLLIADDGSQDSTISILDDFASRFPGRSVTLTRDGQRLGPIGNFGRIIDLADAQYLMLCDHDDVWLPTKVSRSLARMIELEKEHGAATPILLHTDLIVTGAQLDTISPSLFTYLGIDPSRTDVGSLLTANVATGCTMIMNRPLYERARPIPLEAMMHDHWLALVAAVTGVISCLNEPTILYRQHGGNYIGARKAGTASRIQRIWRTLFCNNQHRVMRRYSRQAAAFLRRFGDQMAPEARQATETLATIWSIGRWRRFARLRQSGVGFRGFIRNAALMIMMMRSGPRDRDEQA